MRYFALATDYDGTLAEHGLVAPSTLAALHRLRESGRRLILVTGRELSDLRRVFPEFALFDRIVVENGAQVFAPETGEEQLLAPAPSEEFVAELRSRGVEPLSVGCAIVATWEPHQHTVLEAIKRLGLELQVIFNKGAVMVLPTGVNKASGLRRALKDLAISPHNTVGVGDAENDHALLNECELGVAVQNAVPLLKNHADWVTSRARGAGVEQLIDAMIASDLREHSERLARRTLALGSDGADEPVNIAAYGPRILLCGTSGSGKSKLATALLERLDEAHYQFCLLDPEGDFDALENAIVLGDEQQPPKSGDVERSLASGENSAIVNLLGLALEKRSAFFIALLSRLAVLRGHTGRPHWIVVDEAHHMLPAGDVMLPDPVLNAPHSLLLITVHPDRLAGAVLRQIDTVIVVGSEPRSMLHSFATAAGHALPAVSEEPLREGEALIWTPGAAAEPRRFCSLAPKTDRRRHRRKYAAGELGADKSFFFRGPDQRLNLRAHNLQLFLQIADGVDAETWLYHLNQHDYSRWVREAIKNEALADELAEIERSAQADAGESRRRVHEAISRVYTLPA